MSHSTPTLFTPADSIALTRTGCHHCRFRKNCAYYQDHVYTEALRAAVCQGQSAAQLLAAAAGQFQDSVTHADGICELLKADEKLEGALSEVLCSELALAESLSVQ